MFHYHNFLRSRIREYTVSGSHGASTLASTCFVNLWFVNLWFLFFYDFIVCVGFSSSPTIAMLIHSVPSNAWGSLGGNIVGARGPPLRHQRPSECSVTSSAVPKLRWGAVAKSGTGTLHVDSPFAWLHSCTGSRRTCSGPNLRVHNQWGGQRWHISQETSRMLSIQGTFPMPLPPLLHFR